MDLKNNIREDIEKLETQLKSDAERYNDVVVQMKQLEEQFNNLRVQRDEIAVKFNQDNAVLVKLQSYVKEQSFEADDTKEKSAKA